MSDLIKRSDAIKAVADYFDLIGFARVYAKSIINKIPTADRPQGEWIYWRDNGIKRCKCARCLTSYGCLDTPYCPNCGADMRGADDE